MPDDAPILHAGLIAAWRDGGWAGVLVRGPSGAGKSALALRAMSAGWRLVADDRVAVWTSGGALYGRAPARLHGLLEIRWLGIARVPALPFSRVRLVLDAAAGEGLERMPEARCEAVLGLEVPCVRLDLASPSALSTLAIALAAALRPGLML